METAAQRPGQFWRGRIRVAVDQRVGDDAADFRAYRIGQAVGVFHGIELNHAGGAWHVIGRQCADFLAHQLLHPGCGLVHGPTR